MSPPAASKPDVKTPEETFEDFTGFRPSSAAGELPALDVWNAALEAAAQVVDLANRTGPYQAIASARDIRELKIK